MRRVPAIVLLLVMMMSPAAAAEEVSISDLVTDSSAYDVDTVGEITIEGELVGDFQRRGEWVWVQVNGDAYAEQALLDGADLAGSNIGVGARISSNVFDELGVDVPGGYRVRGAVVMLTGVWRHRDDARGGESWFDASSALVVRVEHHLDEPMDWRIMGLGLLLLVISAGAGLATRRKR
jgi:hypothetical protein